MRIKNDSWLKTKPIAHRGLWSSEIVENSLSAYKNAVNNGYPFEIDLYLSTDGVIYSFHDTTLDRMTNGSGLIFQKSSSELNALTLKCTDERIPTFDEVLEIAENKVPLLIEIKNQPDSSIVDKVVDRLKTYKGEFAIQSFNPLYILRVKKLAPDFIRGILATSHKEDLKNEKPLNRFIIKNMALNFLIKPDFISFSHLGLPLKKSKTKNKAVLTWTITNSETFEKVKPYADNIIFEHFIPQN